MPLYRGWAVVVACGIIASFSWGLGFYGLGVYLHALSRLHGWSAGLISVAVTAYYTLSAGCLVVVGGLIDRHGPRGVLTYGVVTMAAAVALLGVITAPWQLFGLGVGNLITFPPLLARAELGPRSFGTVFGIVGAATQAGVALGPGLMGVLHDVLGSYQPALWCLVTLEALAAAAVLWGRTRDDGGLEPTRGAARAS
jgi:MFS family permease